MEVFVERIFEKRLQFEMVRVLRDFRKILHSFSSILISIEIIL